MSIDASFYKNVFLLMQVVPPSYECKKHFQKGMFAKPNTSGFIQISHYLLSVHDAKRFQRMVTWPIMTKMDERKYRAEIKDYLAILAKENPDINFPSILMSHLLQAGGMRILIVMWKISEISLRTYIIRKCKLELLQAPNLSDDNDLTHIYFTNMNKTKNTTNLKFYEKANSILEAFENYKQMTSDELKRIQVYIFEMKKDIEKSIAMVPVNPLIATRLTDIEDMEIIQLWKTSIEENIEFLFQKNLRWNKLKTLTNTLHSVISNICKSSTTFDANKLPKVNTEIVPLCFNNNIEHINDGMYKDGCLVFHILLLTLEQTLKQLECCLKISNLPDLTDYLSIINEHRETVNFQEKTFQNIREQVSTMLCDTQNNLQEKNMSSILEPDFLYPMTQEIFLSSQKFNFSTSEYINDENSFKKLSFSPIRGKYKHLFTRYKRDFYDSSVHSTSKLQFSNSIENDSITWKSPRRQSLSYDRDSPSKAKLYPRYSRLFSSSDSKRNHFRGQIAASTPCPTRESITPKKSISKGSSSSSMDLDSTAKSLFNLSCKITNVVASLSKT